MAVVVVAAEGQAQPDGLPPDDGGSPVPALRRRIRTVLASLVALAAMLAAVLLPSGAAQASTGYGQLSHVYMDLGEHPGNSLRISYSNFVASLRNAVSFTTNGMMRTGGPVGLVMVTLSAPDYNGHVHRVTLWIRPWDMYVLGFSNEHGTTWAFNDQRQSLHDIMAVTDSPRIPSDIHTNPIALHMGSNYNSMRQAAGRGSESMPVSFFDIRNSILQLARVTNPTGHNLQPTARSLALMTQFTSEAARFWDTERMIRTVLTDYTLKHGLQPWLIQLEDHWNRASDYYNTTLEGRHPQPVNIPGLTTIHSVQQVRYLLAVTQSRPGQSDNPGRAQQ
ncbi:ribosome-inactivating family protein [Streptomyces sp. NPDC048277]|uniref:ribosome-inactivating family protein n=1 Tax=Streptomyces sp. NPDC048277 TaxID=3155027 RepID=UPI0033CD8477